MAEPNRITHISGRYVGDVVELTTPHNVHLPDLPDGDKRCRTRTTIDNRIPAVTIYRNLP